MDKAPGLDWLTEARSEDLTTQLRLIGRVREGVPFIEFARFIRTLGMSQEEASVAFHIPLRTLARRKETGGRMAAGEGERMVRYARVISQARETLGTLEKAKSWLGLENRALGGATPQSLLDTEMGAQAVMEVLGRIEYGVFS